jgi:hypothetical protein
VIEHDGNQLNLVVKHLQEAKMYENFMKLVIIGDEMWVYICKADIKQLPP